MSFQGERLREARHWAFTTQAELACRLERATGMEVTRDDVLAWERNKAKPPAPILLAICVDLGEDLGYFTGEHGSKGQVSAA